MHRTAVLSTVASTAVALFLVVVAVATGRRRARIESESGPRFEILLQ